MRIEKGFLAGVAVSDKSVLSDIFRLDLLIFGLILIIYYGLFMSDNLGRLIREGAGYNQGGMPILPRTHPADKRGKNSEHFSGNWVFQKIFCVIASRSRPCTKHRG